MSNKEKVLFDSTDASLFEAQTPAEGGFDAMADPQPAGQPGAGGPKPGAPVKVGVNAQGETSTSDIARNARFVTLAKGAVSKSLPYMVGLVQPLNGPEGFVFGLKKRKDTKIKHPAGTGIRPGVDEDIVITRTLAKTDLRQVSIDLTDEVAQDIVALFGNSFGKNYAAYLKSGGTLWDGENGPLARFFLDVAQQRMAQQINADFITWTKTAATHVGTSTAADCQETEGMYECLLAELRGKLNEATGKSGRTFVIASPDVAQWLSTHYSGSRDTDAEYLKGQRFPNNSENGYVDTIGTTEVYQSDLMNDGNKMNILMGYTGGPGVSSVYYYPYSEAIVQGGEDYYTGQSTIFYKVRDSWTLNPLDSMSGTSTNTNGGTDIAPNKNSDYLISATVVVTKKAIV